MQTGGDGGATNVVVVVELVVEGSDVVVVDEVEGPVVVVEGSVVVVDDVVGPVVVGPVVVAPVVVAPLVEVVVVVATTVVVVVVATAEPASATRSTIKLPCTSAIESACSAGSVLNGSSRSPPPARRESPMRYSTSMYRQTAFGKDGAVNALQPEVLNRVHAAMGHCVTVESPTALQSSPRGEYNPAPSAPASSSWLKGKLACTARL